MRRSKDRSDGVRGSGGLVRWNGWSRLAANSLGTNECASTTERELLVVGHHKSLALSTKSSCGARAEPSSATHVARTYLRGPVTLFLPHSSPLPLTGSTLFGMVRLLQSHLACRRHKISTRSRRPKLLRPDRCAFSTQPYVRKNRAWKGVHEAAHKNRYMADLLCRRQISHV